MRVTIRILLIALVATAVVCPPTSWGQANKREPHIGYAYPAGGQKGSVFQIMIGGQNLRGVTDVHIVGDGVSASVVRYMGRVRNLSRDERREVMRRIREVRAKQRAELTSADGSGTARDTDAGAIETKPTKKTDSQGSSTRTRTNKRAAKRGGDKNQSADSAATTGRRKKQTKQPQRNRTQTPKKNQQQQKTESTLADADAVKLPNHPLLNDIDKLGPIELEFLENEFFRFNKKKQLNSQIAETVMIEVFIDADAPPGDCELRLITPLGLTNPLCFQVGQLPEVSEHEPYEIGPAPAPAVDIPVTLNGQIRPGDVDRFRFRAVQGQQLVIRTSARHLIPYLADAVPGWFQATLALFDTEGKEVAFADDYRFHPDPVLFFEVPETGTYTLEIHDSIYRGREDFVYRIAVGELPYVTTVFPLGGRAGDDTVAAIDGWNLPTAQLPLDTRRSDGGDIGHTTALQDLEFSSNTLVYDVGELKEGDETEPNDTPQMAHRIRTPRIVNGRIAQAGDVDVFRFKGNGGHEVVAEVFGRRLHSPLDSLLRLTDAKGRVLAWNDDHMDKDGHLHRDMGFITHHADSYLRVKLPRSGFYFLHVADTQRHGGEAYAYRLRVGPPQPDFALRMTPSSLNMSPGRAVTVCVHVLRKDGFDGAIDLHLKDAPPGLVLDGARIPAGRDRVRMTLTAPRDAPEVAVSLHLEGRAKIGKKTITRPVVPAEEMMQAFLYRHLVPVQALVVKINGARYRPPPVTLADATPIRIPLGSRVNVRIHAPMHGRLGNVRLELNDPPAGVTLTDVIAIPNGLEFVLSAAKDKSLVGFADNLIVEAFTERIIGGQQGKKPGEKSKSRSSNRSRNKQSKGKKKGQKSAKKTEKAVKTQRVSVGILPAIPIEIVRR